MSIVLMGFQSVGKSFFGAKIAKALDYNFIDTDRLIQMRYASAHGVVKSIADIHKSLGEEKFRSFEKEQILQIDMSIDQIIALGGGSLVCGQEVLIHLKKAKSRIFLQKEKVRLQNVLEKLKPSYLQSTTFDKMYNLRLPLFLQNHDYMINVDSMDESAITTSLLQLVKNDK